MNHLLGLFTSPEFYPVRIDFKKRLVHFVRMSRDSYRESVFLDTRTHTIEPDRYAMRLDDVLLAAASAPSAARVHYILHPTFCCSTLLARYFEVLPSCFVLKEPLVFTQMALTPPESVPGWREAFDLAVRLLTRTYQPDQLVVIKPHEPCNVLGQRLLDRDDESTITFVMASLRNFLLAVLKAPDRRAWVRTRIPDAGNMANCPGLEDISPGDINDAEAAAYLWLVNMFLVKQLCAGPAGHRVLVLDGDRLTESPEKSLPAVMRLAGLSLDASQLKLIIQHPTIARYSKDLSRPYDAKSRSREMAELEHRWGREADSGIKWAQRHEWKPLDVSAL